MTETRVGPFPNSSREPPYPAAMARRFLGMDRVLAYGPRPPGDYGDVCDRWWRGEPMESIGASYGITRQRIQQIIRGAVPKWEHDLRRHVQKVRHRMRRLPDTTHVCRVCSVYFVQGSCGPTDDSCGRSTFCSGEHYTIWLSLRHQTDDARHASHRISVARSTARRDPSPKNLAYLRRVEAGTTRAHGRWLIAGSKNFAAAIEAFENGWPIFDELPESYQAQVIAAARAEDEMAR